MRFIICANCHKDKPHAAKGLCPKCYKADQYQQNKEDLLKDRGEKRRAKRDERHQDYCTLLSLIMEPMIPDGKDTLHITWDQATNLYNHDNDEPLHFMALCRAVQFQGVQFGLTAHPKPAGGVSITRLTCP